MPSGVWWESVERGGDDLRKALGVLLAYDTSIERSKSRKSVYLCIRQRLAWTKKSLESVMFELKKWRSHDCNAEHTSAVKFVQSLGARTKTPRRDKKNRVTHIDEKDVFGDTALHRAARKGSLVWTLRYTSVVHGPAHLRPCNQQTRHCQNGRVALMYEAIG